MVYSISVLSLFALRMIRFLIIIQPLLFLLDPSILFIIFVQ